MELDQFSETLLNFTALVKEMLFFSGRIGVGSRADERVYGQTPLHLLQRDLTAFADLCVAKL